MEPSVEPSSAPEERTFEPPVIEPPAFEHEVSQDYGSLLAEAERVLGEVNHALASIDDGTYGACEVCGGVIDDRRLEAAPTARTCESHLPLVDPTP